MSVTEGFFLADSPGSTEYYLIPDHSKEEYLQWCKCEQFDDKWKEWKKYFDRYEIIFKEELRMPELEVVIAYVLSCPALLGEKKIAFGSVNGLTRYISRESEDIIFGENDKVLAKDVQWKIDIALMRFDEFKKIQEYA